MSRWSGRPEDRRDNARIEPSTTRAQVEPLAALVAVFAVGVALTTYAGVLDATLPTPGRNLAEPTVERAEHEIAEQGIVAPEDLSEGLSAGPDGYRLNLTLVAADQTWHAGAMPPANIGASSAERTAENAIDTAETIVSVRVGPGRIRSGRLRAAVWR